VIAHRLEHHVRQSTSLEWRKNHDKKLCWRRLTTDSCQSVGAEAQLLQTHHKVVLIDNFCYFLSPHINHGLGNRVDCADDLSVCLKAALCANHRYEFSGDIDI